MEGWFGPVLSAQEAAAQQPAINSCVGINGRELAVRLDMVVTLTSSLAADVALTSYEVPATAQYETRFVDYLVDNSGTPECPYIEAPPVTLGQLQPNQPVNVSVWAVMLNAVSPNEPNPTPASLASGLRWLMGIPIVQVDEANAEEQYELSGERVVRCDPEPEEHPSLAFLALVKGTSTEIRPSDSDRGGRCEEPAE